MADSLGPIPIPDPPLIPPFPLRSDYGSGMDWDPPYAVHTFDQPGLKTEQRFALGSGAKRFRVQRDHLSCKEYDNLKTHWIQAQGGYAQFDYDYWAPSGKVTYRVRYENPMIDFPLLVGLVAGNPGLTLLEVPTITPSYSATKTLERFPDSAFSDALSEQVQHVIPLITIQPRATGAAPLYLSNQRLSVNGITYLPRLVNWGGISQSTGDASDSANFTFGNADDVWTKYVNQVNLLRAVVQFVLFHVESLTLVKLWSGYALPWSFDSDGNFSLGASDGVFELALGYPGRTVSRTCWKVYKGRYCPSTSSLPDCPKSYDACVERGVPRSFGGVVVPAQAIHVKDNTTGTWGFGRSMITSVTVASDTVYQRPVQEVYTDEALVVTCDVAGGRDEDEFYSALGLVGEGPIASYSSNLLVHLLDNQPPHDPLKGGGWRSAPGTDPAGANDYFGISQDPWGQVPPGSTYAGGLAFAEIRRSDEKGLQLSKIADRQMSVTVTGGIGGWTWTAPGQRVWTPSLANAIWVAVNVFLRGIGLRADKDRGTAVTTEQMEQYVAIDQAIAMAAICDLQVPKLVGTGNERQFPFRGILKERKPLKDWIQEILNCCLGYYSFVNGKLWVGIRENSSVLAGNAFTRANILYKSLAVAPVQPKFNWLVCQFGDEEFDWQLNNSAVYDIDAASYAGTPDSPQYQTSTMNLVGVSNKSQAARIASTRLREEVGGVGPTEQLNARNFSFRTTILALRTMVGDIISLDHARLPNLRCEGRVTGWTLNPDFSVDIQASATTDAMYDLTFGPKPDDVSAAPVPPERLPSITGLTWMPNEIGPAAGDPLYPDEAQRTFDLWQDYTITRDGNWDAAIYVAGEMAINLFADGDQPRILGGVLAAGGSLDGPMTVYLGITERTTNFQPYAPSNLFGLWIADGLKGQKVDLTVAPSGSGQYWDLWVGNDRRTIARQDYHDGPAPAAVSFGGPIHNMTEGMPEAAARKIAIAAKLVWHSGIAGVLVTKVTAPNQIQANDFIGSTDTWDQRILSAIADQSDGSAPLWNFRITAFDSTTGTFTVTPDCVRATPEDSVQEGDVLIVRSIGVTADAGSVTDPMWNNSVSRNQFDSPGLRPDEEIGRICRILYGTGAGQWRYITGNTATSIQVDPTWDTVPDETSIIIVEAPDWIYQTQTSDLSVPREGARVELRMRVENLRDHVALVAGFLVDDQDRLSSESVAPMRELYVYGQPPTVRVIGPDNGPWQSSATDHTIRADTSANDVTLNLCPIYVYQGRTLYLVNDNGPNNLIANCAEGEFLFDGAASVTVGPFETVKVTAG